MTLYLKHRPQKISELDLKSVREQLAGILSKRGKSLPHAWLFSGPRGTGKTSSARILAKAVNCEKRTAKEFEPCNGCEMCLEITAGMAVDVVEIDAASNRGIEEIRELREKIKLAAMRAKFKVYIIDEVHMLTPEAANALLKTLEEPPKQVMFVLCTTDAQKLPETVVSRCVQVQFRMPTVTEVMDKLARVAQEEKLEIKNEELKLITQAAKGSFRDAIKILEQVCLSGQPVAEVLGMQGAADPGKLLALVRESKRQEALGWVNNLAEQGVNMRSFIERCVENLREELLAERESGRAGEVLGLIRGLEEAYERTRTSAVAQLPLEIFVIEKTMGEPEIRREPDRAASGAGQGMRPEDKDLSRIAIAKVDKKGPPSPKATDGQGKFKLEDATGRWPEILKAVRPKNHSVEALLRSTRPVEFDGGRLTLEVFYKFHKDRLETEKCRQIVEETVGEIFGTGPVGLILKLGEKRMPVRQPPEAEEDIIKAAEEIFKVEN